jgi:hypothetical protein
MCSLLAVRAALLRTANKREVSVESILNGPRMIAMVATETRKLFTSMPVWKRVYRWLLQIKSEMDGQHTSSGEAE